LQGYDPGIVGEPHGTAFESISGRALADRNDPFDAWHFNQPTPVQILRRYNGRHARAHHMPHLASALLHHVDPPTTERHYIRANSLAAGAMLAKIVNEL